MPVVITPETGVVRHYENYDLAFLWLRKRVSNLKYLFSGPDDFKRITQKTREDIWPKFKDWSMFRWKEDRVPSWETFSVQPPDNQNRLLWIVTNNIADRVPVVPPFLDSDTTIYVDLERCDELMKLQEWVCLDVRAPVLRPRLRKPAWQMRVIGETLQAHDEGYMIEEELELLMVSEIITRRMKTRQSTLRIFRYYRPVLEQLGVLR